MSKPEPNRKIVFDAPPGRLLTPDDARVEAAREYARIRSEEVCTEAVYSAARQALLEAEHERDELKKARAVLEIANADIELRDERIQNLRAKLAAAQKRVEEAEKKLTESQAAHKEACELYGASVAEKHLALERAEKAEREAGKLTDRLDLAHDEFKRIASCPGADSEIKQLCERGQKDIRQHVPVIVQRDKAERIIAALDGEACVEAADKDLSRQLRKGVNGMYTNRERVAMAIKAAFTKAREIAEAE